jgi:hypothetical protein
MQIQEDVIFFSCLSFLRFSADNPSLRILWAAENDKLDIVQELAKTDRSLVTTHDKDGYTPLHRAAYNNHLDVAQVRSTSLTVNQFCWPRFYLTCSWRHFLYIKTILIFVFIVILQRDQNYNIMYLSAIMISFDIELTLKILHLV